MFLQECFCRNVFAGDRKSTRLNSSHSQISYAVFCLKKKSGNNNIDNLIRECQMKTLDPEKVVEWIPYINLQNIKYLTEGGCSKIYTAEWINGCYFEWNSKKQELIREGEFGTQIVVLKRLENVENANKRWLEEVGNLNI